jgi:L-iditol 2-dehydrogenase
MDTLPLPDALDAETATFVEPVACCLRAVRRQGRVAAGDSVLIIGLGAMGLVMVQLARLEGAARVIGSDFLAERRDLAVRLGADDSLDPAAEPFAEAVRDRTGGRGADVVLVCPADARAITEGIAAAAPGARVVCFTPLPPGESPALDANRLYFREIALLQSYSSGPDETRAALELLATGRLRTAPLVTHRAGLEGVGAALARAKRPGEGIKTVILPGRH